MDKEYKINKGMLWFGWEWKKAIKNHLETNDCYILEVFEDNTNNLLNSNWTFKEFKLMGYGNRFKEFKTQIPKRYNDLINSLKKSNKEKFIKCDKWGNKIKNE